MTKRIMEEQEGSVIIIVAIALTALIATASLAIDTGLLYQEKRQLQTSVDAAALAGAQKLAEGESIDQALMYAQQYVTNNSQVAPDTISVTFPAVDRISVEATTTRQLLFARAIGSPESSLRAEATASFGIATAVANLVPVLVPLQFVHNHIGPENTGIFDLGSNRPLDVFRKDGVQIDDTVLYTLTFVNTTSQSVGVTVTDTLPKNSIYVEGSADSNGNYDDINKAVTWQIDSIPIGGSAQLNFSVVVASGSPSDLKNTAQAVTDGGKKFNASTTGAAQKGFFWLADLNAGSGGTPDYADWIENGYPKKVGIGNLANGEGIKAALKTALANRISYDPKVVLPVYDYTERGGSPGAYHVVGFAEFVLGSFDFNGSPKTITGYFTDGTVAAGAGGGPPPAADFGIRTIWLTD